MRYRNSLLEAELGQEGRRLPAARKTGTTIAGVVFKVSGRVRRGGGAGAGGRGAGLRPRCVSQDGVVLGADTRATEGMVVADKNCSKIHYISSNI